MSFILQPDATVTVPVAGNPTATSTGTAINGVAATFMRSDAAFAISTATATVKGLLPTPPNNTTTFLRGDATFATPSNGYVLLSTNVASASTSLEFSGFFSSTYNQYVVIGTNLESATGGADLYRSDISTAGTYLTAGYVQGNFYNVSNNAAATVTGQSSTSSGVVSTILLSASGQSCQNISFVLNISNPSATTGRKPIYGQSNFFNSAVNFNYMIGASNATITAYDKIKFYYSLGATTSGSISLYGVQK